MHALYHSANHKFCQSYVLLSYVLSITRRVLRGCRRYFVELIVIKGDCNGEDFVVIIYCMLLTRRLRFGFGFNILNGLKNLKSAVLAPRKHLKALVEPSGIEYSVQTNLTAEGFDEVSSEWQAHFAGNPFDLQTFNYLEGAQLTNFGTIDNPCVVFSADAPYRFVGCTGPQNEDDYESHELLWLMLREGPLQRCQGCGQVFKLVRLRNEYSNEMDYYAPNFYYQAWQDMGEHQIPNLLSLSKMNTHYEHSVFEQPENTVFSLVSSDEHDRILTDPAYRMQRKAEVDMKSRIYTMAMEDYEREKWNNSPWREPLGKIDYQNLIQAEAVIRKLDRQFRKLTKFHARKYTDPVNHERREKRMLLRSNKRWDSAYTIFSNDLTEEEQRYRDYFETDLQNYREDERVEEFLDKQQLLSDHKYNLNKFDFQEAYTGNPEDDQSSYVEKKIFKFKYRRALDSKEDYDRRNIRMIEEQKKRFESEKSMQVIQNYLNDPQNNERAYIEMIQNESLNQYKDYFRTENDEFDNVVLGLNKNRVSLVFENWQIERRDRGIYKTIPLPEWNNDLGFWANAMAVVGEAQRVGSKLEQIEAQYSSASLSTSAVEEKK